MGTGALFYKADLHIHSYGAGVGSYDVEDTTNTPSAIVDTAILKGLKVISITDHNEILNSRINNCRWGICSIFHIVRTNTCSI